MSDRELVYRISVHGQTEARSAIRSIVQEANRQAREEARVAQEAERAKTASRRTGSTDRRKIVDDEAAHAARVAKVNLAIEKSNAKERVREAKDVQKSKEKAEAETSKFLFSEYRKRQAEAKRLADFEKKQAEEIAKFKLKTEENTSRHIMQERQRAAREQQALQNQAMRQAERDARQFARDRAFEERRLYKGIATGFASGAGYALQMGAGLATRGARSVASGLGLNRAVDVSDIVSERMYVNQKLRAISIEQRGAGEAFDFSKEAAIKAKIQSAAKRTGINQSDLVDALDVFSEKGKIGAGAENIERVASEAKAMGVSPAVVAKLRAQMLVSSDATGKQMSEKDLEAAIARLAFIGKTGVFRAGAMAQQSEALLSRAAASGVDFTSEIGRYAAFANEARKSTGSGATARTAINSIQDAIIRKEGKINALGIATRDESGGERDFLSVVEDIIVKTGGRGDAFNKIIDPSRSGKAIQTMLTAFNAAGGGEKGRTAMEDLLTKGQGQSGGMSNDTMIGEMDKDIGAALEEESTKLAGEVERVRQTIGENLEPILDKLVKKMPDLVDGFQTLVDFLKKNPELGLASILGGTGAVGMIEGLAKNGVPSAARYLAGKFVDTVPGPVGTVAKVASAGADAISSALALRVFVTNWPSGFGPGGGPTIPGGAAPGAGGTVGGVASAIGVGGAAAISAVALMATILYAAGEHLDKHPKFADDEQTGSGGHKLPHKTPNKVLGAEVGPGAVTRDLAKSAKGSTARAFGLVGADVAGDVAPGDVKAQLMAAYGHVAPPVKSTAVPFSNSKDNLLGNLAEKIAEANKALDELAKKSRAASMGVSILKANPTF